MEQGTSEMVLERLTLHESLQGTPMFLKYEALT